MVVFPNCKINIGLNILGKRGDGFHDLETVFMPVPLKDSLEIIRAKENDGAVSFSQSGIVVDGAASDNICVKAYHLLKKDFTHLPALQIHLHKTIPIGAGLGGGSADGAFALQLLNEKFHLGLSAEQLIGYALSLGSDCPFFIVNQPCFATGRGEKMRQVSIPLAGYHLLLLNPGIHINTGWAFAQLSQLPAEKKGAKNLELHIGQPVQYWRQSIFNDFEMPVFAAHPVLKEIKENLYENGAVYAAMSGTGSSVYGIFEKAPTGLQPFPAEWFVKHLQL